MFDGASFADSLLNTEINGDIGHKASIDTMPEGLWIILYPSYVTDLNQGSTRVIQKSTSD